MDNVLLAQSFLAAMVHETPEVISGFLPENACLYIRGHGRVQAYWSRPHVLVALSSEFAGWTEPVLRIWHSQTHGKTVVLAFQLSGRRYGHLTRLSRSILLVIDGRKVTLVQLHCDDELPGLAPQTWLVPLPLVDVLAQQLGVSTV